MRQKEWGIMKQNILKKISFCLSIIMALCIIPSSVYAQGLNKIYFEGREYDKSSLLVETIEWVEWYNSLSDNLQIMVNYIPEDLKSRTSVTSKFEVLDSEANKVRRI